MFIFILLINVRLTAQQGFIKPFNFGYSTAVTFNAMIMDEGELIVCGYVRDSVPPYQTGAFISRIDTAGQVFMFKPYYDSSGVHYIPGEYPGGLIKMADNSGYVFVGNIWETAGGFMMKFDLEGNRIWTKNLEDNVSSQGYYHLLLETEDGLLVGGSKQEPVGATIDGFLMKTNKQGNKLWEKQFGTTSQHETTQSLLKITENEYIIGGTISTSGLPWNQWHDQLQIFAVDSLGNEKWYWESDPPFDEWSVEDVGCRGLYRDGEGNWVYATMRGEFQNSGGLLYPQAKFIKRDNEFNLLEEKTYDDLDGDRTGFTNMIPLFDGDFLMLGNNYEFFESSSTIPYVYAWMIRATESGDSLWTRYDLAFPDTGSFSEQYLHSAVELPSGSIIAAGYWTDYNSNTSDHGLLIKVNEHGCIDSVGCIPTNITFVNSPGTSHDLKVYPNPAHRILHIESEAVPEWDRVEVLDMSGR